MARQTIGHQQQGRAAHQRGGVRQGLEGRGGHVRRRGQLRIDVVGLEEAAERGAKGGGLVLCAGAVWSVYAGFPEVAFVNSLLVVIYFFFRAPQVPPAVRRRLVFKLGVCLLVTILLIAPLVGQFADFLSFSYREGRSNAGGASVDPRIGVAALIVPYIYGPIGALDSSYWGSTAGYLGFALTVLAIAGVAYQWRNRVVQCFAIWAVVCLLKIYGEPLTTFLLLKVPGLSLIVLQRWLRREKQR